MKSLDLPLLPRYALKFLFYWFFTSFEPATIIYAVTIYSFLCPFILQGYFLDNQILRKWKIMAWTTMKRSKKNVEFLIVATRGEKLYECPNDILKNFLSLVTSEKKITGSVDEIFHDSSVQNGLQTKIKCIFYWSKETNHQESWKKKIEKEKRDCKGFRNSKQHLIKNFKK